MLPTLKDKVLGKRENVLKESSTSTTLTTNLLIPRIYSLPSIKMDIKNQELALRCEAPQRLIFHWEGSIKCEIV